MPIYEYRCSQCGKEFEKFVSGNVMVECPACQGRETRRILSLFGMKTASGFVASAGGGGACCRAGGCACHG